MEALLPEPVTFIFSPKFGAYHAYTPDDVRYCRDAHLAGAIRPVKKHPQIAIGRSNECLIQIGRDGGVDENMRPLLNGFSRKHVTLVWMKIGDDWKWMVLHGGVFIAGDGTREACDPRDGVWLNGRRIPKDNPEPLFEKGKDFAKLSLGLHGRIIVEAGTLDPNTTSFPREIWDGDGWPSKEDFIDREDTSPGTERVQAENRIAATSPRPQRQMSWQNNVVDLFRYGTWPERIFYFGVLLTLLAIAVGLPLLIAGSSW